MESKLDKNAEVIKDEKYSCPYCGSPIFSNKVAVWCVNSTMEDGKCKYRLMSG